MEDPSVCLGKDPPTKSQYKELVLTKITSYYEKILRQSASCNSQMKYLNVSTMGLRGRYHPALSNMVTTGEVKLARPHLKFLSGNYLTYKVKSDQSGGNPHCRICTTGSDETVSHVISTCQGMALERQRLLAEFENLCQFTKNEINFASISSNEEILCQFILDPTSLNLQTRVSPYDPIVNSFFKLSRDFCYVIDKTRVGLLQQLL